MTIALWFLVGIVGLGVVAGCTWYLRRRRFLATIPAPFDRNAWQGRWMSRRGSMAGRVFARFPSSPLPPEGDSQADVLIFYEFLRGLYWSETPIQVSVVVHRADGILTSNPDGAAMPASLGRPSRTSLAEELTDGGFIEFAATLDSENLLIIGDFHSPAFDELGSFSLNYRR